MPKLTLLELDSTPASGSEAVCTKAAMPLFVSCSDMSIPHVPPSSIATDQRRASSDAVLSQACSHALTAAFHASTVHSAAISTSIASCTPWLHRRLTLTQPQRGSSKRCTAMAQSYYVVTDVINGGVRQVTQLQQAMCHTHRCLPRFSHMLSCTHDAHRELHTVAAPSLHAFSLRQALKSVACEALHAL